MLVLIVEDNPLIAWDLHDLILEHADTSIVIGDTVATATPLLDQPIDFAFFDVDLPDGKSYGLASQMLARNVPFVFVSGSLQQDMPHELRNVPFICKPFMPTDIARAMRRMPAALPLPAQAKAAALNGCCRVGTVN